MTSSATCNALLLDTNKDTLKIHSTMGGSIDISFDCVGFEKTMSTALNATAAGGKVCLVGLDGVGDGLMGLLLKNPSIFMPLHRKKHHQVAGISIDDLCWEHLRHVSQSKNQQLPLDCQCNNFPWLLLERL